jgi:hypothetical protein
MKIAFLFLIIISLLSCKHASIQKINQTKDSITKSVPVAKTEARDTIPAYTDAIYKQYISASVLKLSKLPYWRIPSPDIWEKLWFKEYKTDSVLVNYISADFNGDSMPDYALILKKKFKRICCMGTSIATG